MGNYVLDMFASFTERHGSVVPLGDYDASTDVIVDVRSMNDKVVLIKNTGDDALTFTILGSIDSDPDPREYDIVVVGDTDVSSSDQDLKRFSDYCTYIAIRVKSAGDTTAIVKVAGTPN